MAGVSWEELTAYISLERAIIRTYISFFSESRLKFPTRKSCFEAALPICDDRGARRHSETYELVFFKKNTSL